MAARFNAKLFVLLGSNLAYMGGVAWLAWQTRQPAVLAAWAAVASNAFWAPLAIGRRTG